MGKVLIIKGADFSVNAIDNVSPIFPVDIDLAGRYNTYAYLDGNGTVHDATGGREQWNYSYKIAIPTGATKIIGTFYTPNSYQVSGQVFFIGFYNGDNLITPIIRPSQAGSTENINVSIPSNATSFVICFRLGYCVTDDVTCTMPSLKFTNS